MNSHSGLGGSLTPGSNSPYRIESPSRTPTNNTPQPQHSQSQLQHSSQASRAILPAADLFANSDLFQTRLAPLRKSPSNDSAPSSSANANGSGSGQRSYQSGLGHMAAATSSSIKSFMPVNKTPEGILIGKPPANDNSQIHPNRLPPTAPSQHATTSTALSRTSSTQYSFSPTLQSFEMERTPSASKGQKRKGETEQHGCKKALTEKGVKRIAKLKEVKAEPVSYLCQFSTLADLYPGCAQIGT